jgi:hypothetical protein
VAAILAEREEAIDRPIAARAASNVSRAGKARVPVRHIMDDGWRQALADRPLKLRGRRRRQTSLMETGRRGDQRPAVGRPET